MNETPALTEFERKRLNKIDDVTKISPREILQLAIDDIDSGKLVCDGLLILAINRPEDEAWSFDAYRSNVTKDQEIMLTSRTNYKAIERWK